MEAILMQPSEIVEQYTFDSAAKLTDKHPVRVIAVTSGKGGVGKTTVSIHLAMAFAALGREVTLLDADLGLANVDVMLGLRPTLNLSHVIQGHCQLTDILLKGPGGITILPAASGVQRMTDLSKSEQIGLIHAFSELTDLTDVLIIDTSAGISESVVRFCAAVQEVIVVVCNEPASITDAYAMIKVLHQEHRIERFKVLVNMAHGDDDGKLLFQKLVAVTQKFLDVTLDLIATIPYEPNLRKVAQQRRTVFDLYPNSMLVKAFTKLADKADNWPMPRRASGRIEFFVERIINANSTLDRGVCL